ncbi:integrator complex subunit 7 [Phlebotomus papatasi]|uniref:integrator complex subunit 7 n=1 Tax=Phlebotomus papatasi TaxID=29031 RepID=UPI002483EE7A|nr:integrator complex subunit 7 [Phlebotomus papatasi]
MMSNPLGIRVNNESFLNESEQDANSSLTELDKGLRSAKVGEQCEAIVRFPKLFEKYPFPILINSSFLKLAEFFQNGSNLLRLWVLRVCQQSEKHLDKILSVDEFVKRIFYVTHSNNPIERALAIRTLGAVARIIPEKQQVHHAIRQALDSHDMVEVEAAIYASVQFAAQSKTFAISMCSKVATMIESLNTPINMKLQLIPVLRHMHHDANTAALVKTLCINLLPKYPSENFVVVILDSLSKLSCQTLVDIPDQVNVLLGYLSDPRRKVRYQVLHSLQSLAEKGAHLWPNGTVRNLLTIAKECKDDGNEQSLILAVVMTLTTCPVTCHSLLSEEQQLIYDLCSGCLTLEHHSASAKALAILTSLILYCHLEHIGSPVAKFMNLINLHLESLIVTSLPQEKFTREFAQYLKCGVQLSEKDPAFGESFVELMGSLLLDQFVYCEKHTVLICETFAALCSQFSSNRFAPIVPGGSGDERMDVDEGLPGKNPIHNLLPDILRKLLFLVDKGLAEKNVQFIEIMTAVCLQAHLGVLIPENVFNGLERVIAAISWWSQYRIARSASRYGHHFLSARIYAKLANVVSLEKLHFFLIALSQISKAECVLMHGREFEEIAKKYKCSNPEEFLSLSQRLEKSIAMYWKALATLKASSSPNHPMTFQSEFIRLRGQFLEALFTAVITKNTQLITLPPAIAQSLAQNSRDHLQMYGHVTNQLRKTVKTFKVCEDAYAKLYKSAFDADPCTLEYLQLAQYLCGVLGNSVEAICFVSPSDAPNQPTEGLYPETRLFLNGCQRIIKEMQKLPKETGNKKSITTEHTQVLLSQIDMTMSIPMCIPRFFFQILQSTSIKLSVLPQPRAAGEPVNVQPNSSLVVKVEGVIQHSGTKPSMFRSIDSVQLTLVSQLLTQRPSEIKQMNDITMTQTVKPHRDFLSGSFLLQLNNIQTSSMGTPISVGGQWQVTVEACVIDQSGALWNTGPKSTLLVRVPDDPSKQTVSSSSSLRRF